eukprot:750073-Hanusia_phi.AAC.1
MDPSLILLPPSPPSSLPCPSLPLSLLLPPPLSPSTHLMHYAGKLRRTCRTGPNTGCSDKSRTNASIRSSER